MSCLLRDMTILREGRSKRIASWDRTGRNQDFISIALGERVVLVEVEGAGRVNKTYATVLSIDRLWPPRLVLRMFWDGEKEPSVEVPFGDFLRGQQLCASVLHLLIAGREPWSISDWDHRLQLILPDALQ